MIQVSGNLSAQQIFSLDNDAILIIIYQFSNTMVRHAQSLMNVTNSASLFLHWKMTHICTNANDITLRKLYHQRI